jgi:hypothetical protein
MQKIFIFLLLLCVSCQEESINNDDNIAPDKQASSSESLYMKRNSPGDAMKLGVKLIADTPAKYLNDLIHPCVRYIPEGFAGHKWWLAASPFPTDSITQIAHSDLENPLLFYGDSREGDLPPLEWTFVKVIEETPPVTGNNTDPALYFDGKGLWVFWREGLTADNYAKGVVWATWGRYTTDGVHFSEKKLFAGKPGRNNDTEMCPIIVKFDKQIKLYGSDWEFLPDMQPNGLAIWTLKDNDLQKNQFVLEKRIKQFAFEGFKLWHFDLFSYKRKIYCVCSSSQAWEVYLGVSEDGENFKFWEKPLISYKETGRFYFYKPTAMVHQGIFYLWHPVEEIGAKPRTSRLWLSEIPFEELLDNLNN